MKRTNKILVTIAAIILIATVGAIYYATIRYRDEVNRADARLESNKTVRDKSDKNGSVNNAVRSASGQNDFKTFVSQRTQLPIKEPEVSIIFAGDVMLSRDVAGRMKAKQDLNYPFCEIAGYLKTADAVFANLESPITPGLPVKKKEFKFRADPGVEKALSGAGFTVLSLANNHSLDFGRKGFVDTTTFLKQAGIVFTGAGINEQAASEPAYLERQGIKFAFLAYADEQLSSLENMASANNPGTSAMNIDSMKKAVKTAKKRADYVIVSMHAGDEYIGTINHKQIEFAHGAIDVGADIVVGHHPHVVQKVERYKEKYIFYSLGNFIFDQMWSEATREGVAIKAYFSKKAIKKFEFQPVLIKDFAQPNPIDTINTRSNDKYSKTADNNDGNYGNNDDYSDNRKQADRIINRLQVPQQTPLSEQAVLKWNRERKIHELEDIENKLLVLNSLDSLNSSNSARSLPSSNRAHSTRSSDSRNIDDSSGLKNVSSLPDSAITDKTKLSQYRINKSLIADLNNDKQPERYSLNNGRLTVMQGSKLIWKTKDTWWVDDFALVDSNNDRKIDLNMSVWKSGSFGSSKPFWVKENDRSIKNHFFVFKFDGISVKPAWQSSNLDRPNREFLFCDLDDDGTQELIAVEGEYAENKTAISKAAPMAKTMARTKAKTKAKTEIEIKTEIEAKTNTSTKPNNLQNMQQEKRCLAVWKWNGWGFSCEWRSASAAYSDIRIMEIKGIKHIVADKRDVSSNMK